MFIAVHVMHKSKVHFQHDNKIYEHKTMWNLIKKKKVDRSFEKKLTQCLPFYTLLICPKILNLLEWKNLGYCFNLK